MTANGSNGHVVATATAVPMAVPAHEGSQPILPPRTTARAVQVQRPPSMWRSWPMLVIALAVVAIVAATVIMVLPASSAKRDGKMSAPPAPERMETNPLPDKSSQIDPWSNPGGAPPQAVPQAPQPQPADPDDDLWGSGGGGVVGGGGLAGGSTLNGNGATFMISVLDHACSKFKSCPDVDQSMLTSVCDAVAMMPKPPAANGCQAAQRCFDAIDHMSCSQAQSSSPQSVLTLFQDCTRAATQC